jgi:hypothetical protein
LPAPLASTISTIEVHISEEFPASIHPCHRERGEAISRRVR